MHIAYRGLSRALILRPDTWGRTDAWEDWRYATRPLQLLSTLSPWVVCVYIDGSWGPGGAGPPIILTAVLWGGEGPPQNFLPTI